MEPQLHCSDPEQPGSSQGQLGTRSTYTDSLTDSLTNKKVGQHADVSGGLTQHFVLPLSATKVVAHGKFHGMIHSDDHEVNLGDYPLQEWATNDMSVHLKGVWPGATKMWI